MLPQLIDLKIPFYKYQGAGNDFVILDQTEQTYVSPSDKILIRQICDRRFGVGADGLMYIERSKQADFKMVYFNADGRPSSMCGNGGRCIVALAHKLGIIGGTTCVFDAVDGLHKAKILTSTDISIEMKDVDKIISDNDDYILNTGSPHFVRFVDQIEGINMVQLGRGIRNSERFIKDGINVNYVSKANGKLQIRTYERGVEDETLACGTGVTAAAIAAAERSAMIGKGSTQVEAMGGDLNVSFERDPDGFKNIWLTGPAVFVFEGIYLPKRV